MNIPTDPAARCEANLALLREISETILENENIGSVARQALEVAAAHAGASRGVLMRVNSRQELSVLAASGLEEEQTALYRETVGEGLYGRLAAVGEAVLVEEMASDSRFGGLTGPCYPKRSIICCPVADKSGLLGLFCLMDPRDGLLFDCRDLALAGLVAGQLALAMKNARLKGRLKSRATELEEANRQLIAADLAKTEFLARLSHELRTPLNSIKGAVYYLRGAESRPLSEKEEFHSIIASETTKLIGLVEKQFDFLRLEDETRVIQHNIFDLRSLLQEVLDSRSLSKTLEGAELTLEADFAVKVPDVVGDRILAAQLLHNLFTGVAANLSSGRSLKVSLVADDEQVEVRIEADGPLPEEFLKGLFDSRGIFHLESAGDGVKLYLALKAAEAHGWRLAAVNTGQGLLARLSIPRDARRRVDAAIDSTMDLVLDFTSELLGVQTCSLMLGDQVSGDLSIRCARGLDDAVVRQTRIRVGDRIAGWVALEGKPLLVEDLDDDHRFAQGNHDTRYNSDSLLCLPLRVGDRVAGVLNLNNKKNGEPFCERDLRVASVLGDRISFFLENLQSESFTEDELGRLVNSLEALTRAGRKYHKKNCCTAELMSRMLDLLGASDEEKGIGLYISMIYDLGLMMVDQELLGKEETLSAREKRLVNRHPRTTLDLLAGIEPSTAVRRIILHHHERYDGTGYPKGLKGEEIPLVSKVLAVADSFCAMTEERPYRESLKMEAAICEILDGAGSAYDPRVVSAFEKSLAACAPS